MSDAELFGGLVPRSARFSRVAFLGGGQFAAVFQVFQNISQFAQDSFSASNLNGQVGTF